MDAKPAPRTLQEQSMVIKAGENLPDAKFKVITGDGPAEVSLADLTKGRKTVIVGVPGAFTGTCHNTHIPGYLENLETLKARGIDEILVISVNDHHVMNAWQKALNAAGKLQFLADFDARFTKAIGMEIDMSAGGLGLRSRRYAIIAEDGVAISVNAEESPGIVDASGAGNILGRLQPQTS
jgi:glutaredoxin/glutathione-dependent peroxiredoxin